LGNVHACFSSFLPPFAFELGAGAKQTHGRTDGRTDWQDSWRGLLLLGWSRTY